MLPKEHNTRPERRCDMKDLLTVLVIVAAIIYCIAVAVVPVHHFEDCCYCGKPVEVMVDQNHWHDEQNIICDDCWCLGRR